MRKNKRSADFYRITSEKEALYYSAEIPSYAWGRFQDNIKFLPIMGSETDSQIKISESKQIEIFKNLQEGNYFNNPYLVYLSSPDLELANRISFEIMKLALAKSKIVQITNAADIKQEKIFEENIFLLTNVFTECTTERIQDIRDWVTKHEDCFRLVSIAGSCPYAIDKRLKLKPHLMFHITKDVIKIKTVRA